MPSRGRDVRSEVAVGLSEADTRAKLIDPAIRKSQWDEAKIKREVQVTKDGSTLLGTRRIAGSRPLRTICCGRSLDRIGPGRAREGASLDSRSTQARPGEHHPTPSHA